MCDTNICIYRTLCNLKIGYTFDFNAQPYAKNYKCAFDFIQKTTNAGNKIAVTDTIKKEGFPVLRGILEKEVFDRYRFRNYDVAKRAALEQSKKKLQKFFDNYSLSQLGISEPLVLPSELDAVKNFYLAFIDRLKLIALRKKRPDPLPEESDRRILAEVSKISQNIHAKSCTPNVEINKVGLCSNDHDFTEFVNEITGRFNILVHPLVLDGS